MKIEVKNLWKSFGDVQALKGVSVSIPSGAAVGLIGPNGSGKSTFLRILMGMLTYEGQVCFDGTPLNEERGGGGLARSLAYVPQVAPLFPTPVAELIRFACRIRGMNKEEVQEKAQSLGLDVTSILNRSFRALSGGMRQKLLIALALCAHPRLLILDEPTASLDPSARDAFLGRFASLAKSETTIILASHRLDELTTIADRVMLLDEGAVCYDGSAELFSSDFTKSIVMVKVQDQQGGEWLGGRGFSKGNGFWWVRSVRTEEKASLIREMVAELNGRLLNIVIRDLEHLHIDKRSNRS